MCKDSDIDKLAADKITANADWNIYRFGKMATQWMPTCYIKKTEDKL
jgi:hypothetical protein